MRFFCAPPCAVKPPRRASAPRRAHLKTRDAGKNEIAIVRHPKERALRGTVRADGVVAMVGKFLAGLKVRKFPHHAITLDHHALPVRIRHHPFPSFDRHRDFRVIVNGQEINERVRTLRRRIQMRHVLDTIDRDAEAIEFGKIVRHRDS